MNLFFVLSVLLGVGAACYALLGLRAMSGKYELGSAPLSMTLIIVSLWVMGGAVELLAGSYSLFSIGRLGHYLGTALTPVTMLACFRDFTGKSTSWQMMFALLIVPFASIAIAATNQWHEFMWALPATNAAGEFLTRPVAWGPWFKYVHAPYSYCMIAFAVLSLITHSHAVAPVHRRNLLVLAGSAVVPMLAAVAYDLGYGPTTISTLPLVLTVMFPAYAWLIIGKKITEFSPLAYETVFQNMQDPVVVVDDQQRVICLNHGAETLLNVKETAALRLSLESLFGEDVPEVQAAISSGKPQKMMTNTGRFLHLQVTPIETSAASARSGRVLMFRDVSDVENAQKEVRSSEMLLRTLVDHSVNGIIRLRWFGADVTDRELLCIFANAAAGRFLETNPDDLIDKPARELIALASTGLNAEDAARVQQEFEQGANKGETVDTEAKVESIGKVTWLRIIGEPVGDDIALTFVDVSDRKAKEFQMESIALSDPLTGVLNRRGFEREATERLAQCDDLASGALLFIDLNEFKQINDRCGHEMGDQLLTIAAERLRKSLRSCDVIGRPGGDEFVALVPDVPPEIAGKLALRLTESLEQPYLIGKESLQCAASIGLALYPENANTLTGLMRAADQAMYRAKARWRDGGDTGACELLEKAI